MPLRYRKEVEDIRAKLNILAQLVSENVNRSLAAVSTRDEAAAERVIRDEHRINRHEVELEEECVKVMTLHQPVADELRFLVATLKVNNDLERIGDLAAGIAKRSSALCPEDIHPFQERFRVLTGDVESKIQDSMKAFFERDYAQAIRLWLGDDKVDAHAALLSDEIHRAIRTNPERHYALLNLLNIVQRIERLADHAANVAKNVIYLTLGEIVRHRMDEFRRKLHAGKTSVLFVCVHNSARSQMAAAWLNHLFGEYFHAESAGLQPGVLNPLAVRAMWEEGVDISGSRTRDVYDVLKDGNPFSYVITVCDEATAEKCPPFPGTKNVLHWDFPDPNKLLGDEQTRMVHFREIRDAIRHRIQQWILELPSPTVGE